MSFTTTAAQHLRGGIGRHTVTFYRRCGHSNWSRACRRGDKGYRRGSAHNGRCGEQCGVCCADIGIVLRSPENLAKKVAVVVEVCEALNLTVSA